MIGNITQRGPVNNSVVGSHDYGFARLHELAFGTAVPEFKFSLYKDYWDSYGNGFDLTTFLNCAGFTVDDWTSSRYTVMEQPNMERAVMLGQRAGQAGGTAIPAGAAGAAITFQLDATEYDANGDTYRLVGTEVYIPKQYCGALSGVPYRVTGHDGGAGAARIYTAVPLANADAEAGLGLNRAASTITVDVPAGEFLVVGPIRYGRGGGQPAGTRRRNLQRDFYLTILAESMEMEGGVNTFMATLDKIDVAGNKYFYSKALYEMEFLLERQKDKAIWKGYKNENIGVNTTLKRDGVTTAPVESFEGIRDLMEAQSQVVQYVNNFELWDMQVIKELKESQGDMGTTSAFICGPRLRDNIWENGMDIIQDYSRGTDLVGRMDELGVDYKVLNAYGHKLLTFEASTFVDRTSHGHPSQGYQHEGFIVPLDLARVSDDKGKPVELPHLGIGYRKGNNEDRTNMTGVVSGVNGMGFPFVDQFDSSNIYMKTEFGIVALGLNKWVLVTADV